MIRRVLTFNGLDDVTLAGEEYLPPENRPLLYTEFSMVSPGTELFCIRGGGVVRPGYIRVGRTGDGRRCFLFPSMAESSAAHCDLHAPDADSLLLPLPEELPPELAGFLRFINIGLHPFHDLPTLPERVAVIGLGPVGNLAAQSARLLGCDAIGVDPSEKRRELAVGCGVKEAVSPDEFAGMTREFDLVIDTVSASSTLEAAARNLKEGGTCSIVGIVKDGDLSAAALCREIWIRDLRFRSGWEMKRPMAWTERNLKRGLRWMLAGGYVLRPLLSGIVRAEPGEICTAYRNLAERPDDFFCYAIDWR